MKAYKELLPTGAPEKNAGAEAANCIPVLIKAATVPR